MKNQNIEQFLEKYNDYKIPIMFYDLSQLEYNIKNVIEFEKKYNVKFLFPVKSFPHEKIIKIFAKYNFGYDVANNNEYSFIKEYIKDNFVSFNGINYNIEKVDTKNVIYYLNSLSATAKIEKFNGLRINPSIRHKSFSKFGITIEELKKIHNNYNNIESISFHFYEDNKYKKQKIICQLYRKVKKNFPNLKYINIGGNWDVLDKKKLEENLIYFRKNIDNNIKIFLEIGENWFENCGYLFTKIVAYNNVTNKKIYYVDAVKESIAKWSVLKPLNLNLKHEDGLIYIIAGSSCYEKDVFYVSQNRIDLNIGDVVVFKGLNGYSYAWNKEFNGSKKPEVIFYE